MEKMRKQRVIQGLSFHLKIIYISQSECVCVCVVSIFSFNSLAHFENTNIEYDKAAERTTIKQLITAISVFDEAHQSVIILDAPFILKPSI